MVYLTCFACVCEIFTVLVLTAATYICRLVCLFFRKLHVLAAILLSTAKKKICKVDVGHVFLQKFNRDILVCLPLSKLQ